MSHHRALLLKLGMTFVALLCCPVFAQQPVAPQNQSASPSEFTVNVSKGNVVAPPVNPPWPPVPPDVTVPPDVSVCLKKAGLGFLGAMTDSIPLKTADKVNKFLADPASLVLDVADAVVDHDPLQVEWVAYDAVANHLPDGFGPAYGIVSNLVEAKVRLYLAQQGYSLEQRDELVHGFEDSVMEQINRNSPLQLVGSEDPLAIINSAVNQALNMTTGRSLDLVDPIDEFVASRQAQQALQSALDSGANTSTGGGLVGAEATGQFVPLNPQGTIEQNNNLDLNSDAEFQISSELVDNQPVSTLSSSGTSIVDSGPLIRPVEVVSAPSSGGFWQNLGTALQFANLALQTYQATRPTHQPTAPASAGKQQVQPSAGRRHYSCSSPEECAALRLVQQTCSLRNDCSKWSGLNLPPQPALPPSNPGQGCSIQCGMVGNSFECVGNAFTAACPIVY